MDRIESLLIQAVAVGTLVFASFAGYHAVDLAHTASLPVVQLERVVVVAPAATTVAGDL